MSTIKLTMIGLDNWYKSENAGDIFDGLTLPTGIDKATLTNNILLQSGEFEVLYADPSFMFEAITLWGQKWYRTFEKWYEALQIEYNPLDNFDRHEEYTDNGTTSETNLGNGSVSNSTKTTTTPTGEIHNDHYVTPYENNTKTLESGDVESYTDYKNENDTVATSTTSTGNTGTGITNSEHKGHLWGNIGVTTSQQMLQSELDIATWNLYEHITDIFLKEFCIMVY